VLLPPNILFLLIIVIFIRYALPRDSRRCCRILALLPPTFSTTQRHVLPSICIPYHSPSHPSCTFPSLLCSSNKKQTTTKRNLATKQSAFPATPDPTSFAFSAVPSGLSPGFGGWLFVCIVVLINVCVPHLLESPRVVCMCVLIHLFFGHRVDVCVVCVSVCAWGGGQA